ncbi:MAG: calcium-binding protein [Paracoccaceae bacterium]|jgi:Ca2+-binding RTX toxin-like protein|nr:calcium-binding protein [Paracoccaceae bacterium]
MGGVAATVLNFGSLSAFGLAFGQDNFATGGQGGAGGLGGIGGAGGEGGDGFTLVFDTESPRDGGDGGDGGDTGASGDGGDGGDASAGILNFGDIAPIGAIATTSLVSTNPVFSGGVSIAQDEFGAGGEGGKGGSLLFTDADDGKDGAAGSGGIAGRGGKGGISRPLAPNAELFETIILATTADSIVSEGDNLVFSIQRVGVASDDIPKIRFVWRLEGLDGATAADLGLSELPSGEVLFEGRRNDAETFLFDVAIDTRAEGDETFALVIEKIKVTDDDKDTVGIATDRATATISENDAPPVPGLLIEGTPDNDDLRGGGGPDTIRGGQGDDTLRGFAEDDLIVGFAGDDLIRGQRGNDELRGSAGDDRIFGNGGDDRLLGNGGADELRGGGGDDRLEGGKGDDVLTGGRGANVFVFGASDGDDFLVDFQQGLDRIAIVGSDGFEDLLIAQTGADVTVSFGATDVRVLNQTEAEFTEDDFLF